MLGNESLRQSLDTIAAQFGLSVMGTLLLLTAEAGMAAAELAEAEEAGGFGLNFNLLETNLINLSIVLFLLVYLGRKFLGNILAERRSAIEKAIQDAEKRRQEAAAALAEQQQKLAQAQAEADRIRASAEEAAQSTRDAILAQAAQDIQRLKEAATQETNTEQQRAITELRRRVVALAIQKVEGQLSSGLEEGVQHQLVDRSIAMLGGRS